MRCWMIAGRSPALVTCAAIGDRQTPQTHPSFVDAHARGHGPRFRSKRPPLRSRSTLTGWNGRPNPGGGYGSVFPLTSCLIPSRMTISRAPFSPSIRAVIWGAGLASDRVSEGQASIARVPSKIPPRHCLGCPHIKTALRGPDCHPLRSTSRCRPKPNRASESESPFRRPKSFLRDPQGAHQRPVQQARDSASACRPSNLQALRGCRSKDAHRVRRACLEYSCWGDAHPLAAAMGPSERPRIEAGRIPCPAIDNRRGAEQFG
jgi:hypothetical protein